MDVFSRASLPLSRPDTIIVIDRDLQALCEFSKPRQASESGTLASCWIGEGVIVVRRATRSCWSVSREDVEHSRPGSAGAHSVLGFAVVHRDGDRLRPPARPALVRDAASAGQTVSRIIPRWVAVGARFPTIFR
jgi:hypothetical protein